MDFQTIYQYSKDLIVLYIEDDDILRDATLDAIEDYFGHVESARNGEVALQKYKQYYEENAVYYDVVITDINMPVMDGIELIEKIYALYREQSIIIVSAYSESDKIESLKHLGIKNFIMKPIAFDKLKETIYSVSKDIHQNV